MQNKRIKNILLILNIACKTIFTGSNFLQPKSTATHVIECIQELNLRSEIDPQIRMKESALIFEIFYQTVLSEPLKLMFIISAKNLIIQGFTLADIRRDIKILQYWIIRKILNINRYIGNYMKFRELLEAQLQQQLCNPSKELIDDIILKKEDFIFETLGYLTEEILLESVTQKFMERVVNAILTGCELDYIEKNMKHNILALSIISLYVSKTKLSETMQEKLITHVVSLIMQGCELDYINKDIANIDQLLQKISRHINEPILLPINLKQRLIEIAFNHILAGNLFRDIKKDINARTQ